MTSRRVAVLEREIIADYGVGRPGGSSGQRKK
jgi:hypothetical protein